MQGVDATWPRCAEGSGCAEGRPSRQKQRGWEAHTQVPQLEEQPLLAFAIPACLTGPDGITSLPKNNQTEPISLRSTTQRHRGQETGNVNALPKPAESRAGRGSMRVPGWVPLLSTLLLVRQGSAQDGEWPLAWGPWELDGSWGVTAGSLSRGEGTCGSLLAAASSCVPPPLASLLPGGVFLLHLLRCKAV